MKLCIRIRYRDDPVNISLLKGWPVYPCHYPLLCPFFRLYYSPVCFMHDQIIKKGEKSPVSWMALFNPMVQWESGSLLLKASLGGGPARPC